ALGTLDLAGVLTVAALAPDPGSVSQQQLFVASPIPVPGPAPIPGPPGYVLRWGDTDWVRQDGAFGVGGRVDCMFPYSNGPGPHPPTLAVGGQFVYAGDVIANNVAIWNGSSWSALAGGVHDTSYPYTAEVRAMATSSRDPNLLYVGGYFSQAGSIAANNVA